MPLLRSCCQPPWCLHLSRKVLAVTLCYEIYIAFTAEPFPSGQLSDCCIWGDSGRSWPNQMCRDRVQDGLELIHQKKGSAKLSSALLRQIHSFHKSKWSFWKRLHTWENHSSRADTFMGKFCLLIITARLSLV